MLQHIFCIKELGSERPVALATISRNISGRRRAEEALHRAQAELAHATPCADAGRANHSIAHEVTQPLAAVVTSANAGLRWLTRETPDLDEARASMERIIQAGNRAHEVIQRIRALAKEPTRRKPGWTLATLCTRCLPCTSEARQHRVALRRELSAALPPVLSDRVQLQQVVLDLLLNDIEAMHAATDSPRGH